ncbi:hypothetical protein [Aureliella helgolandensis]|uniref:Uncharacterized protein n=1 Tax=Aureliella helgolandensis TaxID=2527968 RepID=A0A518G9S5_9BACT|nr:hypothetical protein [Aureliella helgolandensis]QDV25347.1 hypothetical protein Q31a_36720 [Aureliella helgolandensis]
MSLENDRLRIKRGQLPKQVNAATDSASVSMADDLVGHCPCILYASRWQRDATGREGARVEVQRPVRTEVVTTNIPVEKQRCGSPGKFFLQFGGAVPEYNQAVRWLESYRRRQILINAATELLQIGRNRREVLPASVCKVDLSAVFASLRGARPTRLGECNEFGLE